MLFEIELEEMLVFEDAVSEWLLLLLRLAVVVAAEAAAAALLLVLIPRIITINRLNQEKFQPGGHGRFTICRIEYFAKIDILLKVRFF